MFIKDFRFDGKTASDFGLMPCQFDGGGGTETSPAGVAINFNQVSTQHGMLWLNTATTYDSVLETTIQMCKDPCEGDIQYYFSLDEQREIGRWLNQKKFKEFTILGYDSDYDEVSCFGSFDQINKVQLGDKVIGYELHLITNRPYMIGAKVVRNFSLNEENNYTYELYNPSDEVGYIYPDYSITCNEAGDLKLTNELEHRITVFKDVDDGYCLNGDAMQHVTADDIEEEESTGEVTIKKYPIERNYNYCSFRIARTENTGINIIKSNLDCDISLSYRPIIKGVGF